MSTKIAIEIPDIIANRYATSDELKQGLFEDILIREFQKGHLSIRECAALLEISYEDFLIWLGAREISFVTATEDELNKSYQQFESFMQTYKKP